LHFYSSGGDGVSSGADGEFSCGDDGELYQQINTGC